MFEIRAICHSHKCKRHVFTVQRKSVKRTMTSGQPYTITKVVCPKCKMWATISTIKEVGP